MPDLAERTEDIPLLATHFLERFAKKLRKPVERIEEDALALLMDYPWPGNVRELENCIERAVVLAKGSSITAVEFPPSVRALQQKEGLRLPVGITLEDLEREAILRTLAHCNGNRAAAAKMLGLAERTLYRKLRLYNTGRADRRPPGIKDRQRQRQGYPTLGASSCPCPCRALGHSDRRHRHAEVPRRLVDLAPGLVLDEDALLPTAPLPSAPRARRGT